MTQRQTAGAIRHRSAEPRLDWQTAPPGMTPDPRDREFRSIQVEHAGSAECILRRSMRGVRQGCALHLLQAKATAGATADYPWVGGMGPVAGDAVNPSLGAWPRHPCRGHSRNRTHPAFDDFSRSAVDPRHAWMNLCQITKSIGVRSVFQRKTDLTPCRPPCLSPGQSNRHLETVEGGAVSDCGVSAAWMPRPSPHGRVYGVPAIRHRPAKPQTAQSRFGFGFEQVQGAALPAHPPLRTKTISLISANRHPFATPVPYCGAACAHGRPMLKIARPSLRSIQDDAAMAGSWGSSNRTYQATRAVLLPLHGDSDKVTSN